MNIITINQLEPQITIKDFISDKPLQYATKELIDIIVRDEIIALVTLFDNKYYQDIENVYVTLKENGCLDKEYSDTFENIGKYDVSVSDDLSLMFKEITIFDSEGNDYKLVKFVPPEPEEE